jgi:plastocyanin
MARRTAIIVAAFVAALALPALPAGAGGGCHSGATQGEGDTVEMVDACFTPSILRVQPGDAVTFVNRDSLIHNVGGNLWGNLDDMNRGDAFTATFDEEGVYPFACSYHPGMTGAIVVGSGSGAGNGEDVGVATFEQPEPVVEVRTVTEPSSGTPVAIGWIAGAVIGVALGFGIAALVRRNARPAA